MTAGYPDLNDTVPLLRLLEEHGADMVEVGIPFSDPLADGPVIQHSSQVALRNGMNLQLLFRQLEGIREKVQIPLVLMGYFNPILRMGVEPFLDRCKETGIDAVIIPDLPPEEFEEQFREQFEARGIFLVMLVTPHTSEARIRRIADLSGGFLYMVAEASTTGARAALGTHQVSYFRRMKKMNLPLPALIGFGISNRETFETACSYASGAIIGSAFIKAVGEPGPLEDKVIQFISLIRGSYSDGESSQ
jgi:tryptophan synthase alpha chain